MSIGVKRVDHTGCRKNEAHHDSFPPAALISISPKLIFCTERRLAVARQHVISSKSVVCWRAARHSYQQQLRSRSPMQHQPCTSNRQIQDLHKAPDSAHSCSSKVDVSFNVAVISLCKICLIQPSLASPPFMVLTVWFFQLDKYLW